MKIKAVIFDLDGTLLNTLDDLGNSVNYTLNKLGYEGFEIEEFKYKVGNGIRKLIERSLPVGHKSKGEIDKALEIFMSHYSAHSMDKTAPYDGIFELLEQLQSRKIKTAVVTNKADTAARVLTDKVFPGLFDKVTGQTEGVPTKPDPTSVFDTMSFLDVKPEECIFIGDSGVDMQTGVNAGAYTVGVLWGFRKHDELVENGAKSVISAPNELIKIIDEL